MQTFGALGSGQHLGVVETRVQALGSETKYIDMHGRSDGLGADKKEQ